VRRPCLRPRILFLLFLPLTLAACADLNRGQRYDVSFDLPADAADAGPEFPDPVRPDVPDPGPDLADPGREAYDPGPDLPDLPDPDAVSPLAPPAFVPASLAGESKGGGLVLSPWVPVFVPAGGAKGGGLTLGAP
jgi:hypothetical protein